MFSMGDFGHAAIWGFCWGFAWGIIGSIGILYSIYLVAYRKAIKDSLKQVKPPQYTQVLDAILAKKAKKAKKLEARKAKAAAKSTEPIGQG
jgi:uncharacterized membrane protein YdjX (TVP38/TMEM64 family)